MHVYILPALYDDPVVLTRKNCREIAARRAERGRPYVVRAYSVSRKSRCNRRTLLRRFPGNTNFTPAINILGYHITLAGKKYRRGEWGERVKIS